MRREVWWDGIYNARDLGGLPTPTGLTMFGRFYRAPRLDALTPAGWVELVEAGVRSIIDLRSSDERRPSNPPSQLHVHHLPIEDPTDQAFLTRGRNDLGSPVYYQDNLHRWPEKLVAVFTAMAAAPTGGIVFHCSAGRDRTGLVAALLLTLAGVAPDDVIADYEISIHAMNDFWATTEDPWEQPLAAAELAARVADRRHHLASFLAQIDPAVYLTRHGMRTHQVSQLQDRLTN